MKSCKLTAALSALLLIAVSLVHAADGSIGETSDATSNMEVQIAKLILLTGVPDNINFGPYTGGAGYSTTSNVRVSTNIETTPKYFVKATGSGTEGAFTLASGSNLLAYTVKWYSAVDGGGTELSLVAATQNETSVGGAHSTLAADTNSASFKVEVSQAALRGAYSGTYTGTLNLEVDPE